MNAAIAVKSPFSQSALLGLMTGTFVWLVWAGSFARSAEAIRGATAASMRYALAVAGFETVFSKRLSGSIFIAARPAALPSLPAVSPALIWLAVRVVALLGPLK